MKTTVSSKGEIVLPAEFREMDHVEPGQQFDVERLDRGDYRLVRRAARQNEGAIGWLLACPRKDYFVPIDSESTDSQRSTWRRQGSERATKVGAVRALWRAFVQMSRISRVDRACESSIRSLLDHA